MFKQYKNIFKHIFYLEPNEQALANIVSISHSSLSNIPKLSYKLEIFTAY